MFKSSVIAALSSITMAASKTPPQLPNTIVIDKDTLVLNQEINDDTVAPLIKQVLSSKKQDMTMFIKSPGGSIDSGMELIQAMHASGKTFICVAEEAISMAFVTLQLACTKRVVLENSTLMQHQAAYGLPGRPERNQHNLVRFIEKTINTIEKKQAARLGLTTEAFKEKTNNDWWMDGDEAIENKAADVMQAAVCTPELAASTHIETRQIFVFQIQGEVSDCPLISTFKVIEPKRDSK